MLVTTIRIGGRPVGDGHPCLVIAEAGINHQGNVDIARQLIDVAADVGVDVVKFQKRTVSRILTREGLRTPYLNRHSFGKTYGEHKRALELTKEDYRLLKGYADERGLLFMASAWDEESVDFLEELGVPAHKTASADLTNLPLLARIAQTGKPLLMSTGMSSWEEIDQAVETVRAFNEEVILLQCTSTYPSEFEQINLRVMPRYRQRYGLLVGYSGHEKGIAIPPAAVALGAAVVERHFTLDRTMKGGDHAASLEPQGLQKMVRDIRALELALGDGEKRIYPEERPIRQKLAKSVVSAQAIPAGTVLTAEMLTTKGPGTGISAGRLREVIGRRVIHDVAADTVLHSDDLE